MRFGYSLAYSQAEAEALALRVPAARELGEDRGKLIGGQAWAVVPDAKGERAALSGTLLESKYDRLFRWRVTGGVSKKIGGESRYEGCVDEGGHVVRRDDLDPTRREFTSYAIDGGRGKLGQVDPCALQAQYACLDAA
jgi:hypothetical protein